MLDKYSAEWERPALDNMGWDIITNPTLAMFYGAEMEQSDNPWTTTYRFGDAPNVPGRYDSMGNFYPQQGPGQAAFNFKAGSAGGMGSGGSTVSASHVAPEVLSAIPQGTSTAGLGLTPEAVGLGGTSGITVGSGAGAGIGKWVKAGTTAYSALQNAAERKTMADFASQGGTESRTPYQLQMLNPFLPYILQEALNIFKKRQTTSGRSAGNFDPLIAMLGNYMKQYTGNR